METDFEKRLSQPIYKVKEEKNVSIITRDGTRLAADIYYPDAQGKFPTLISYACYSKDLQKLPLIPYPLDDKLGNGSIEAGNTEYFVSRGYVHVIADPRGVGLSEGGGGYRFFARKEHEDGYDIVEWIARQTWSNGNVGMFGMSYFAMIQYFVAALNPPHLKAIFPHDACADLYRSWAYHGGILNYGFTRHWWPQVAAHTLQPLDHSQDELNQLIEAAKENEDIKRNPYVYLPLIIPAKNLHLFDLAIHPYDGPYYWERSGYTKFKDIRIPTYLLSRWNAHSIHLPGAFSAYKGINAPKKLRITVPHPGLGFERPWHENHEIILRWYDHWLKGIDTGIMEEPPISAFVQGANQWRFENEWPLARTRWTKFYLRKDGVLTEEPPANAEEADSFTYKPGLRRGQKVPSLEYTTRVLTKDLEITGPSALNLFASLSTTDANWHVEIYDIGTDGSKRLITMGWLKASHREVDEGKSKPYQPFHPHRQSFPVGPGRIYEYPIGIVETSNTFKAGHRMHLVIKGQDTYWEGPEYFREIHFHLDFSKESRQTIHHTSKYPSHLLLPVIP